MPSPSPDQGNRRVPRAATCVLGVVLLLAILLPGGAPAEQASAPGSPHSGSLDVDAYHSCALLPGFAVRCWGHEASGQLGLPGATTIGDDETPAAAGPVDLGPGRTARAIATGVYHSCALLDDGSVRCWGYGTSGQLGYASTATIGDDETPGSTGPVDLGRGRTAKAISAGSVHTCAVLDDGSVRCWGYGEDGRLGTGNTRSIGDDETPGSIAPVDLGPGRTARTVSAGAGHTCAVLDDGSVRCWGYGANGRLGYGSPGSVGDDETPGSLAPIDLGRSATAITLGEAHTCAVLDDATVRCWGFAGQGQLGYGDEQTIGDDEPPVTVGPVDVGPGPGAAVVAISAGDVHTCALLAGGEVRCWGHARYGLLGNGSTNDIGDNEIPATFGGVDLGRGATAISAGSLHNCARLDNGAVRCWGYGGGGRLGNCSDSTIGDDESPGSLAPVELEAPSTICPALVSAPAADNVAPSPRARRLSAERLRLRRWSRCMTVAQRRVGSRRARQVCAKRHGRTPGRVLKLRGRARSRTTIVLSFGAAGTDGPRSPAARRYLVKQSLRPLRSRRDIARAPALCRGSCRFSVSRVGSRISLNVRNLRPRTTYHYRIAALDNVSGRPGRSRGITVRTR